MFGLYLPEPTRVAPNCRGDSANNLLALPIRQKTFWLAANEQGPKPVGMGKALTAAEIRKSKFETNSNTEVRIPECSEA
jgi:hypothetical protein